MNPFDKAWAVLKSPLYPELHPDQTTLGEHHADFPSRAGPMSMMRVVPSEYMQDIDNRGLQPLPQDASRGYGEDNAEWEEIMAIDGDKKFDTTRGGGKGFWVTKPDFRNVTPAYAGATPSEKGMGHSMVGIRMTPEDAKNLDAQWRNAKQSPEGFPEGLIHEAIDPRRLVMMRQGKNVGQPMNWHDESTWGNMPRDIKDLAYDGGVGETERPDMWDWETE
tara:strand:+ start:2766 stop:3425 length:660 start_codon:yes stop_codon:yes gene_type:complete